MINISSARIPTIHGVHDCQFSLSDGLEVLTSIALSFDGFGSASRHSVSSFFGVFLFLIFTVKLDAHFNYSSLFSDAQVEKVGNPGKKM
jgi:hypothetical protein